MGERGGRWQWVAPVIRKGHAFCFSYLILNMTLVGKKNLPEQVFMNPVSHLNRNFKPPFIYCYRTRNQ